MNKKKILFLGAARSQVPAIKYAKQRGLHVITVDYLPDNPGHKYSEEYYNISTTDKVSILDLAKTIKIDAISAYASDPAAPTAAFVCDNLGLIGSSYESVSILSDKQKFREFLKKNNYLYPRYISSNSHNVVAKFYTEGKYILKPVDSSGSKGITIIKNKYELKEKFEKSKSFSKSGRVILEEYIERKGPQIHGEGFVLNGEVVFMLLGDQVFSSTNNVVPYSTTIPSYKHQDIMPQIEQLIKDIIQKIGFKTGGINVEVIRDQKDNIYVLEIGARNGGNFMPQLEYHATGFDLVKANIDALFGEAINTKFEIPKNKYYSQIILHAKSSGIYNGLRIPKEFSNIKEKIIYPKIGDKIYKYKNSSDVLGILILEHTDISTVQEFNKYLYTNDWIIL